MGDGRLVQREGGRSSEQDVFVNVRNLDEVNNECFDCGLWRCRFLFNSGK